MTPTDEESDAALERVAEAVSDGTPVNWVRERSLRPELRPELDGLEVLARVRESHVGAPAPDGAPQGEPTPTASQETTRDASAPAPLFRWGALVVLEKLGEGGFGEVYRAFDPHLETEIALKLRRAPSDDAPAIEKFLSEARRLARVRHTNVLTVHGADVREGRVGIWTELIVGETLEQYLQRHGPLGAREAAGVGIDLCRALAAVHAAGVIHRDVKTGNVMRERGGRIVLMDFGSGGDLPRQGGVDETDHIHGTPLFMAPEQLQGVIAGPGTDVYALGVVLYRLVTGKFPLAGNSLHELIAKHQEGPTPLRDVRPDLPSEFVQVIHKALAPSPEDRYATAGAMELALASSAGAGGGHGADAPVNGKGKKNYVAPVLAGMGVLVAAALVVFLLNRRVPTPPAPPVALTADVVLLRVAAGREEALTSGARIQPGDNLAMTVQGTSRMHFYVLDEDASGEVNVLYPLPGLEPANPLPPGRQIHLPGRRGDSTFTWHVTSAGGRESVIALASRDPLRELEQAIAGLPRAEVGRPVRIDRRDVLRLRGIGGLASRRDSIPAETGNDLTTTLMNALGGSKQVWLWHTVLQNP